MFIVQDTATAVKTFSNLDSDNINWVLVAPGKPVVKLIQNDWITADAWLNAGVWSGSAPDKLVPDPTGKKPADIGYIPTYNTATPPAEIIDVNGKHPADVGYVPTVVMQPPTWKTLGNTLKIITGGLVELINPDGTVNNTLTGTSIQ